MTEYKTNQYGIEFYIERSKDFDNNGRVIDGRGWFAGLTKGREHLGGVWFETREQALDAIHRYEGDNSYKKKHG